MGLSYVYSHTRQDTQEVFYIGIGSGSNFCRAYDFVNRSNFWKRVAAKGVDVEILHSGISYDQAKKLEIDLIKQIGRRDLGKGPLVNLTDGGEGTLGYVASPEARRKISKSKLGKPRDPITQKKLAEGGRRYGKSIKGKTLEEIHGKQKADSLLEKMRQPKPEVRERNIKQGKWKGQDNPMYGKTWEDLYGPEEANRRKKQLSERTKRNSPNRMYDPEVRRKLSESKKGIPSPMKGKPRKKLTCPYCDKRGGDGMMQRWHFENCKHKPVDNTDKTT